MRTLYDSHFVALGFLSGHALLAGYVDLTARMLIAETLIGLLSLSIFAWIDFVGYEWRWPLSKRPVTKLGTFD